MYKKIYHKNGFLVLEKFGKKWYTINGAADSDNTLYEMFAASDLPKKDIVNLFIYDRDGLPFVDCNEVLIQNRKLNSKYRVRNERKD